MTRISLKEAYDNKDVAVQIFSLRDDVDKHSEILENLPDPDLTNCVLKTGAQTIAGEKTFTDKIHAEGGVEVDTEGGFEINGPLTVNGDIIQNGQAYETHAEQVFSQNDLIVTRDGAVSALPAGVVSGIQIKKYDGVNDARLAVDNAGVARVGDVGDEQPLMTRDEVADMVGGAFLKWDAVHSKAVSGTLDDTPTAGSSNGVKSFGIKSAIDDAKTAVEGELATVEGNLETAIAGKVSGTGNVGSDTKPIKIVNGAVAEVSKPFWVDEITITDGPITNTEVFELQSPTEPNRIYQNGKVISVSVSLRVKDVASASVTYTDLVISQGGYPPSPTNLYPEICAVMSVDGGSANPPLLFVDRDGNLKIHVRGENVRNKIILGSVTYVSRY